MKPKIRKPKCSCKKLAVIRVREPVTLKFKFYCDECYNKLKK